MAGSQNRSSSIRGRATALPSHTRGGSRMRESRTYGSVRGACDETHVPTATTPGVHLGSRRRGGGVAARGAGAAGGDAGGRVSQRAFAGAIGAADGGIPPGPKGQRLRRGRERDDHIPLGGGSMGSIAGT